MESCRQISRLWKISTRSGRNSLAQVGCGCDFECLVFKDILASNILSISVRLLSYECYRVSAMRSQSTLVQVMALCRQTTSHYLSQYWPMIYTNGQRYGITTNKWHLREFDRYLLFLVVCSIAEQNTVDFINPLHNQIEWPNAVSIVWGPLRLKRIKKASSGVVTWSEVCLAITILMFLCSVGFR